MAPAWPSVSSSSSLLSWSIDHNAPLPSSTSQSAPERRMPRTAAPGRLRVTLTSATGSTRTNGSSASTSYTLMSEKFHQHTLPSAPPVTNCCRSRSRMTEKMLPSCGLLPSARRTSSMMKLPSHMSSEPCSLPLSTLPSGSSANASMSDSSTLPNLPISPCSFRPVKVAAMRQKRMWPWPEVARKPGWSGELRTANTDCENALVWSTMRSSRQSHTVSRKSGKEPTDAICVPSAEKSRLATARSVPLRSTR
mmetsp:Transcript_25294/g.88259  ORF Transcript_25294/g.88259 Transcript_25294/m.88259 type:complete len:251 (-) Transcript_25294:352-1104(-)